MKYLKVTIFLVIIPLMLSAQNKPESVSIINKVSKKLILAEKPDTTNHKSHNSKLELRKLPVVKIDKNILKQLKLIKTSIPSSNVVGSKAKLKSTKHLKKHKE